MRSTLALDFLSNVQAVGWHDFIATSYHAMHQYRRQRDAARIAGDRTAEHANHESAELCRTFLSFAHHWRKRH